jgi:hypothetical protein
MVPPWLLCHRRVLNLKKTKLFEFPLQNHNAKQQQQQQQNNNILSTYYYHINTSTSPI